AVRLRGRVLDAHLPLPPRLQRAHPTRGAGPGSGGHMKRAAWVMPVTHASLVVICLVTLYPAVWVVGLALSPTQGFTPGLWPLPAHPTLANFAELLADTDKAGTILFVRQMANSVIIAAMTTGIRMLLSTTAAYAMSRFAFVGRQ